MVNLQKQVKSKKAPQKHSFCGGFIHLLAAIQWKCGCLRTGFALFLREKTRVGVFFPAHVREKTFMRKSPCFARSF